MSKGNGGTRMKRPLKKKTNNFAPLKETDKAVMISAYYDIGYAPEGGFSSSMVQEKGGTINVWVPKTQIKEGKISEWMVNQKVGEIQEKVLANVFNAQILHSDVSFFDKNHKEIPKDTSITDKKIAKGLEKHDKLLAKAKSLGIKGAKINMKTQTLSKLISDKEKGIVKTNSASQFAKSSTKVAIGSVVKGKYGNGVIDKIITKSSGYVQVKYENGQVKKEMAFNLMGEDGKYLKKKP